MTPEELYRLTPEEIERIRAEELFRLAAEAMDRITSEELDAINSKLNRDNAEHYAKRQAAEELAVAQKLERAGLGDVDVMAALQSEAQAKVEAEERERAAARAVLDNMDMVRQALDESAKDYIHTRQSAAGSKKGQADRLKVLELWEKEWPGKRENTGAFARWAFKRLAGEYSAAGKKADGVPAERTIRKWINEIRQGK